MCAEEYVSDILSCFCLFLSSIFFILLTKWHDFASFGWRVPPFGEFKIQKGVPV